MREVQLDESRNCSLLIHLPLEAEVTPSAAVGEFYDRGLAIRAWRARLHFLNRGESAQPALQAMLDSHVADIGSCEALL